MCRISTLLYSSSNNVCSSASLHSLTTLPKGRPQIHPKLWASSNHSKYSPVATMIPPSRPTGNAARNASSPMSSTLWLTLPKSPILSRFESSPSHPDYLQQLPRRLLDLGITHLSLSPALISVSAALPPIIVSYLLLKVPYFCSGRLSERQITSCAEFHLDQWERST